MFVYNGQFHNCSFAPQLFRSVICHLKMRKICRLLNMFCICVGFFVPFNLGKQMATGFGLFASFFLQAITSRCIHQSLEGVKKPISVQSGSSLASSAIEQEHYLLRIVLITEHQLLFAVKNIG